MRYFTPFIWIPVAVALAAQGGTAVGQEENAELAQSRAQFEREIAFSTRPIRDRYLSRLESMKRSLGSRGDARAAAAVQDEIDRVLAMNPEPSGLGRFAGVWMLEYAKGVTRRYSITLDGSVSWDESGGKPLKPPIKSKLALKGSDFLVEWSDGTLERFKTSGRNLVIDHFSPKSLYPAGQPTAHAAGVNSANR